MGCNPTLTLAKPGERSGPVGGRISDFFWFGLVVIVIVTVIGRDYDYEQDYD